MEPEKLGGRSACPPSASSTAGRARRASARVPGCDRRPPGGHSGVRWFAPGIVHSLERRRPGRFDGGNRMLGVGLLVTPGIEVKRWRLIERALPERTLSVELTVGGRELHVVVFHALAGVSFRHAKSAQFIAIAEHLVEVGGDVVLIGDANEPMIDSRTIDDTVFWDGNGKGAEYLFGSSPVHQLKDAWRAYLADAVREKPVGGPLAVSYRSQKNARRYDPYPRPPVLAGSRYGLRLRRRHRGRQRPCPRHGDRRGRLEHLRRCEGVGRRGTAIV